MISLIRAMNFDKSGVARFRGTFRQMLTMKGKNGLKALTDMALADPAGVPQSAVIANRHGISKKFLDAILAELRVAGVVTSRKGRMGGYRLVRPADVISVGDVLRVPDRPLALIACASRTAYVPCIDCKDERVCAVRLAMLVVRDAIAAVLDKKTLKHLAARASRPRCRCLRPSRAASPQGRQSVAAGRL